MTATTATEAPRGLALIFHWHRLRFVLIFAFGLSLLLNLGWKSSYGSLLFRLLSMGLVGLVMFGLFEQWPKQLPRWLARWVLQVVAVGLAMPFTVAKLYVWSTPEGDPSFWHDNERMAGFSLLCGLGIFIAPWVALAALVRQKDALARHQALELDLQKSELERQASQARLNLLQAQVAPHFLFNTLANVQALVETQSPQAPRVLASLIAYLRAAVPRLDEPATTLGQELALVQAYLELMHMRMPDRLAFDIAADPSTHRLRCPPMTLLTLVENAVRHGIDPSEDGGRIALKVLRLGERCRIEVADSGVGIGEHQRGLGTGLSSLRERLALVFGDAAGLSLSEQKPHGVLAVVEFPAQESPSP